LRRIDHTVHLLVHAGSRRAEVARSYPLLRVGRNSGRILAEEGIEQEAVRRSSRMVVADHTDPEEVDNPAEDSHLVEKDSLDRSWVVDGPVARIDRMGLT
jgi:hypothetical protein